MSPQFPQEESPGVNLETEAKLSIGDMQTFYNGGFDFNNKVFLIKKQRHFAVTPVGLLGYAMCCFCVGLADLNLIKFSQFCMTVFFVFGGLLQYIMGILNLINGDTLNAHLAVMYGWFNASSFFWNVFSNSGWVPFYSNYAFASFNFMWLVMTCAVVAATVKGPKVNCVNNIIVGLSFLLNMINGFVNSLDLLKLIGAVYLLIAFTVVYISFAIMLNVYYGRTILPLLAPDEKSCCKK